MTDITIKTAKNLSELLRALEKMVMAAKGFRVHIKIDDLTDKPRKKKAIEAIWKFFIDENVFYEFDKFLTFSDDYSELIITHIPGYREMVSKKQNQKSKK